MKLSSGRWKKTCDGCKAPLDAASIFCPKCGYANLEGRMAGPYRLQARLGAGGMGVVYRAEHEKLGTAFAVKVLHKALASNSDVAKRFLQEAKATSRLRHEHIIFLADYGEIPDISPYIAMEYLEGQPLSTVLEQTPILPFRRTFAILEQVCEAMQYAHDEGIIHRDLKPDNLFLLKRREGQRDFVKILDFGIAKILDHKETKITKTGFVLGTPHYVSPEQVSGGEIDHRADVFATAVMLFRMLTGKFPYDGDSMIEILSRRLLTEAPLLSAIHPLWKGSPTEALVQDGLRMDKEQRLPSMQDFLLRLQDALPSAQDMEDRTFQDLVPFEASASRPSSSASSPSPSSSRSSQPPQARATRPPPLDPPSSPGSWSQNTAPVARSGASTPAVLKKRRSFFSLFFLGSCLLVFSAIFFFPFDLLTPLAPRTSEPLQPRPPAPRTSEPLQPRPPALRTSESLQPRPPAPRTSEPLQPRPPAPLLPRLLEPARPSEPCHSLESPFHQAFGGRWVWIKVFPSEARVQASSNNKDAPPRYDGHCFFLFEKRINLIQIQPTDQGYAKCTLFFMGWSPPFRTLELRNDPTLPGIQGCFQR